MRDNLTDRQRQILEFIEGYVQTQGCMPSIRDIGKGVGLSSSSTIHAHLESLQRWGHLTRQKSKPRSIKLRSDVQWVRLTAALGLPATCTMREAAERAEALQPTPAGELAEREAA